MFRLRDRNEATPKTQPSNDLESRQKAIKMGAANLQLGRLQKQLRWIKERANKSAAHIHLLEATIPFAEQLESTGYVKVQFVTE